MYVNFKLLKQCDNNEEETKVDLPEEVLGFWVYVFWVSGFSILGFRLVKRMREEYGKLGKVEMSIWDCCVLLNDVVDESDPDLDEPQIEPLPQTVEAIRKDCPNEDWLHLTALIHGDLHSSDRLFAEEGEGEIRERRSKQVEEQEW